MIDTTGGKNNTGAANQAIVEEKGEDDQSSIRTEVEEYEQRMELPVLRDPNDRPSIWKILSSLIGKDLSRNAMPVFLNEPTSMIQKVVEIMEYQD